MKKTQAAAMGWKVGETVWCEGGRAATETLLLCSWAVCSFQLDGLL